MGEKSEIRKEEERGRRRSEREKEREREREERQFLKYKVCLAYCEQKLSMF